MSTSPRDPMPVIEQRRDMCFVFGSNTSGIHGAGAARYALLKHGAIYGQGIGHHGNSYAIPTKEMVVRPRKAGESGLQTLPLVTIQQYVDDFINYAAQHPELKFQVTRIGCGLAGLRDEWIAPMFYKAPDNCFFDTAWKHKLSLRDPHRYNFWGTFE